MGSISGWGRSPREGNGIPQQYFCLGNPMDRGNWWATIPGVAKNQTTKQQQKQWLMMLNIPSNAYLYIFSVKCLFMSFAHFLIRAFILSLLSLGFLCILQILILPQICGSQIFSHNLYQSFHGLHVVFHRAKVFNFYEVSLSIFLLYITLGCPV